MFFNFQDYKDEIKNYCQNNKLSFDKLKQMPRGASDSDLIFQYFDKQNLGRNDLTIGGDPMRVVLWVKKENNQLRFEQTEYTRKYLSN